MCQNISISHTHQYLSFIHPKLINKGILLYIYLFHMYIHVFRPFQWCEMLSFDWWRRKRDFSTFKFSQIFKNYFFYMSHFAISTCDGKELISFSENSRHIDNFSGFIYIKRLWRRSSKRKKGTKMALIETGSAMRNDSY